MMDNNLRYKVLWIDDEHEELSGFKFQAKREGIDLVAFKSLNGGINELKKNSSTYDGVLLDAKFYKDEDDTEGSEDTDNVHRAKEQLLQLKKKFEIFILTGQAEAYNDTSFNKAFLKVYKKGSSEDNDRLFEDLKKSALKQEDTQLKYKYKRVFDVCCEKYIGEHVAEDILSLLKVEDESNSLNNFNTIRKIVEDLFKAFAKFKLLPLDFIEPQVALNPSSIFLAGRDQNEKTNIIYKKYKNKKETHLHPQIINFLKNILYVVQNASHRSEIDDYVRQIRTPFLFKSILFQLFDVIIWFKDYVDSNPKRENWEIVEIKEAPEESVEFIQGIVINKNIKGFAFFKSDDLDQNIFIPPLLVERKSLEDGMKIKIEIEKYTDSDTEEVKMRAKRVEKIES